MSNWWGSADGDASKAFSTGFELIPDGAFLVCEVKEARLRESQEHGRSYQLHWRVLDGEFKGRVIFHTIKAFDPDENKSLKARNMLMLLFKMFNVNPPENAPTDRDFHPMAGKVAAIKVGAWHIDGKSGNFVREVHEAGATSGRIESAFSTPAPTVHADDIPF